MVHRNGGRRVGHKTRTSHGMQETTQPSSSNKKIVFIIFGAVGLVVYTGVWMAIFNKDNPILRTFTLPFSRNSANAPSSILSPNILALTQPVYSISGTITKVGGDTMTIAKTIRSNPGAGASPTPSQITEYKVQLTDKTKYAGGGMPLHIPYRFSTPSAAPAIAQTKNDLTPGMRVTAISKTDLRELTSASFTADSIQILQSVAVRGTIKSMQGSELEVVGLPITPPQPGGINEPPKQATYRVSVSAATELSYTPPYSPINPPSLNPATNSAVPKLAPNTLPAPQKLTMSDLHTGLDIMVYTDKNTLTSTSFPALLISPIRP